MTSEREEKFRKVVSQRQGNLTVVLENVHDPHNMGAVLRSCDAVGVKELYLLYTIPSLKPETINVHHTTSSGARKWVDVYLYEDANACFEQIRKTCDKVYGTHMSEEAIGLHQLDLTASVALLFGNEREGLTKEALSHCDGNFLIPMKGMVQSLNISVACAVSLYEALRQREAADFYEKNLSLSEAEQTALLNEYRRRHEVKWTGKSVIHKT